MNSTTVKNNGVDMSSNIVTLEKFETTPGEKITLVGGCFDILHIGHIRFLKHAKTFGGTLLVALESDEFIAERKKRQPFHTQQERAEILAALRCVDKVVLLPYFTSHQEYHDLVEKVRPTIIVTTAGDPKIEYKKAQAVKVGARIEEVPHIPNKSTSEILRTDTSLNKEDVALDS